MAAVDICLPYKLDRFDGTFKSKSKCRGSRQLLMMMDGGYDGGTCNDWTAHALVPHSQGPSMSKIAELTRLSIEQSTTEGSTTLITTETRYTSLSSGSDLMSGGILTTDGSSASTLVGSQLDTVLETCLTDLNRSKKRDMCRILCLSLDVASWTPQNVHDWLEWAGKEHGLPQEELAQALTNFDNQQLTGLDLCSLSLEDFCLLFPRDIGGDLVYGLLQDWKDDFTEPLTTGPTYAPPPFPDDTEQTHQDIIIGNPMLSAPVRGQFEWSAPGGKCWSTDPRQRFGSTCSTGTISPDVSSSTDGCCSSQTVKIEISDTEDDEIDFKYLQNKGWRNPTSTAAGQRYPKKRRSGGQPILWLFLHDCLAKPEEWSHAIKWVNRKEGIFQFSSEHKEKVARRWGEIKGNRCIMSYQKMARSLRNYSNNNIVMKKVRRKLQYQFLPQWLHV
ncbi:ETS-related transcription factor Elf-3-like isoform X1 [Branchiostoma floridae]|uniref:ETS-related transcription factor Elf-3-like isoform X1 n=3 Tax=Branchiostoma floridae TaxID=7739 RepID=A0A9J7KY38_BRAFL|nr:ETS-related transcription factor Elf-3-like isoform X1 [Branchiostoma floridae]